MNLNWEFQKRASLFLNSRGAKKTRSKSEEVARCRDWRFYQFYVVTVHEFEANPCIMMHSWAEKGDNKTTFCNKELLFWLILETTNESSVSYTEMCFHRRARDCDSLLQNVIQQWIGDDPFSKILTVSCDKSWKYDFLLFQNDFLKNIISVFVPCRWSIYYCDNQGRIKGGAWGLIAPGAIITGALK